MATQDIGLNKVFPIYNEDGTSFYDLKLRNSAVDSVVMSLGDKITGFVYYPNNAMPLTMHEYIEYNDVHYMLLDPPTIVREGIASENSELKGMTKYSFTFYHPMVLLSNFPFADVAVSNDEQRCLSENKKFSWIGTPPDFVAKINKNLQGTKWIVIISDSFPQDKLDELSDVMQFDKATIADALKRGYETWDAPYVIDQIKEGESYYSQGKRFKVIFGLPSNEIYASERDRQLGVPYVFKMGQGVGLKNNSRTPRNNKIITRISGYGSTTNIPYGYPQIVWNGSESDPRLRYPLYDGIVGGQSVKLIKHPFTRTNLMPSIYVESVNKKVNPNATGYNPNQALVDYYDAIYSQEYPYVNTIVESAPSYEIHEFDIKPELGDEYIVGAIPLNNDLTPASGWDDTMDDDGNYIQSYFRVTLPQLSFDLYACASITEEMEINMRGGACIGCTFQVQIDWEDYKLNFYDDQGNFAPNGEQRDLTKYPKSNLGQINVVCKKENTTFGVLMPNMYQYPQAGDAFVILGISLPQSYITIAEHRLDDEMKSYMLENNVHYYDYPLKFDEYFLSTHTEILSQIRPNTIVRFQFADEEPQPLFVKQLTIKYGDNPLPQYEITLTDNVEIVLNQLGRVVDDIEKLSTLLSILRQNYSKNVWAEISKKLSKVDNDTAAGIITFLQDIIVEGELKTNIIASRAQGTPVEILEQLKVSGNESVTGNLQVAGQTTTQNTLNVKKNAVFGGNADEHSVAGHDLVAFSIYGAGYGWQIDRAGNMEVESLTVRSYLETKELRINRLQAQEGDTIFTDNDQIETVQKIVDDVSGEVTYLLTFKEKWEGYFTAQRYGNILKGIINTLAAAYTGSLNPTDAPVQYNQVVNPTGNPSEQGYYEYTNGQYLPTTDIEVVSGKTYYTVEALDGYEVEPYSATLNPQAVGLFEQTGGVYVLSNDTQMNQSKTYYRQIQRSDDGGNKYFTSWMYVVADRNTAPAICGLNQVLVALWGDNDSLPQNKNFAPCKDMVVGRWGCLDYSEPIYDTDSAAEKARKEALIADIKKRQTFFYISSSEGRFMKLNSVATPLLDEGNYGTVLGSIPDFIRTRNDWETLIAKKPHLADRDFLYSQGVIYSDLIQLNIKGVPIVSVVDCGDWIDGTTSGTTIASADDTALADENDNVTFYEPGDTVVTPKVTKGIYYYRSWNVANNRYETHTVRHRNGVWMCLQDQPVITNGVKTYYEPKWNSIYWKLISGDARYTIEIASSAGSQFYMDAVDTILTPHLFYGDDEITSDVIDAYWSWTRETESGKTDQDRGWDGQHQYMRVLHLQTADMPSEWSRNNKAIFTVRVTIIDGRTTQYLEHQVIA